MGRSTFVSSSAIHADKCEQSCSIPPSLAKFVEERTNPSSEEAAQPRSDLLWHHAPPFILAPDIPRGILQLVLASVNSLFMLTIM